MTGATNQAQNVKGRVAEGHFFDAVSQSANRIGDAACKQPGQTFGWKVCDKRFDRKDDGPAHEDVHRSRNLVVSPGVI